MKTQKQLISIFFLIILAVGFWYLTRPCLFIKSGPQLFDAVAVRAGSELSVHFVHSVQKTPVDEYLTVDAECRGLVLNSTRYQSFGVGLPFAEAQGSFRQESGSFIYENLNRKLPSLSLRTGLGTKLTVRTGGKEYRLFELLPVGKRVDIYIDSYYKCLF